MDKSRDSGIRDNDDQGAPKENCFANEVQPQQKPAQEYDDVTWDVPSEGGGGLTRDENTEELTNEDGNSRDDVTKEAWNGANFSMLNNGIPGTLN